MPSAETEITVAPRNFHAPLARIWASKSTALRRSILALLIGLIPAVLYEGARGGGAAQELAGLAITLLSLHAVLLLGVIRTVVFASVCLTVTFAAENLSIGSGFPFGRYQFLFGQDLVHVGAVPIIIGPVYFSLCYQSWIIASLIVNAAPGESRSRLSLVFVPVVAAFTSTQWDLVSDPPNATLDRHWIWLGGGGFLGVPLSNFLGWFLTTWIVFQLFQLFSYRCRVNVNLDRQEPLFLMLPILAYLASGLCYLVPPFGVDQAITDGSGRVWSSAAIRTVAQTLALFTLLPTSCLALIRITQQTFKTLPWAEDTLARD